MITLCFNTHHTAYEQQNRELFEDYHGVDSRKIIIKETLRELDYLADDVALTLSSWVVSQKDDGRIQRDHRYQKL